MARLYDVDKGAISYDGVDARPEFRDRYGHARHGVAALLTPTVTRLLSTTERRRDLPCRDCEREIPWRYDAYDADGLACDLDTDARTHARQHIAGDPQGLSGEEVEYLCRAG